jgi:hypothetical protein
MKKTLIALLVILLVAGNLFACTLPSTDNKDTVYDTLNKLAQKEYRTVEVKITTNTNGLKLYSTYITSSDTVEYSVEAFNSLEGGVETLPEEYKSTFSGVAKIKDGKVTEIDGDTVSLPSYGSLKGAFNFKKENFKSMEDKNGKFTAIVIDPSNLLGISDNGVNNMKITVRYNDSAIESILLTYNTGKSSVITEYIFGL